MISITAFGSVPRADGASLRRQVGDRGVRDRHDRRRRAWACDLGRSTRRRWTTLHSDALVQRYRVPQPRVRIADSFATMPSASMDVSDGLAGDLAKLCGVSAVSAVIDLDQVPLSSSSTASGVAWSGRPGTLIAVAIILKSSARSLKTASMRSRRLRSNAALP